MWHILLICFLTPQSISEFQPQSREEALLISCLVHSWNQISVERKTNFMELSAWLGSKRKNRKSCRSYSDNRPWQQRNSPMPCTRSIMDSYVQETIQQETPDSFFWKVSWLLMLVRQTNKW